MRQAVAAILVSLIVPSSVFAQSPASDTRPASGTSQVEGIIDTRSVRLPGELRLAVSTYSTESSAQASTRPQTQDHRHTVLIAAAIGAGAGYLINAAACRTGESVCSAPGNLLMAGIGAGVGALVGVLIARR